MIITASLGEMGNPQLRRTFLIVLILATVQQGWTEEHDVAFSNLKELLVTAPILKFVDFTKEFYLEIDVKECVIGCTR